jgi:hypothetical protein
MLKRFSWNRIRIVILLGIENSEIYFDKDDNMIINFLYHKHSVLLKANGKGLLWNPWDESEQAYSMMMPYDIQIMVQKLLDTRKKSIPIDMKLN